MGTPFGDVSIEALKAGLLQQRGGKRVRELASKIAQALANSDSYVNSPLLTSCNQAVSLGSTQAIELSGQNLLLPAQDAGVQAVASLKVFGTVTNYVTVYARGPGKLGNNIQLTIQTPGVAASADSDTATDLPKVSWTPAAGDVDASITNLNATSKLVYAVKTGTGGTLASLAATKLAGGIGAGVKAYIGQKLIYDNSTHQALFIGSSNGSYIQNWDMQKVTALIHNSDLAVGQAVPTGHSTLVAVVSQILFRLEWTRPLYEAQLALNVKA